MAEKKSGSGKGVALAKRAKIDSAQRNMFVAVALASIILGVTIVGSIYLVRLFVFNNNVSAVKDEVIDEYKKAQSSLTELTGKVSELAKNERLEVVARSRSRYCENNAAMEEADGETSFAVQNIELARTCSSLRVIPDALPAVVNLDSSRASMIVLLDSSNDGNGVEAESVTGGMTVINGAMLGVTNVGGLMTSISLRDDATRVRDAMDTIESSIRNYDITSATITWSGDLIELKATYTSYYSGTADIQKSTKIICADDENDKCKKAKAGAK